VSAVSIALYYVLSAKLASQHGVITMSAWTSIFGNAFLVPISMWEMSTASEQLTIAFHLPHYQPSRALGGTSRFVR
jgi:hypothetical protein